MSERDAAGLSRLDADRAHSMADEGGVSAALVDCPDAALGGWSGTATALACVIGLAAGVGLVALWRAR
jgi:hypothetical protein